MTTTDFSQLALDWHRAGRRVAIATVVKTWGSAPRPVGSQMVIDSAGALTGSVSGGCVEAAVIAQAIDAIEAGKAVVLDFGVSDDDAFAAGLACGGDIKVLVEPVGTALPVIVLENLVDHKLRFQPVAYVANLNGKLPTIAPSSVYAERFALDQSGILDDGQTYVGVHNPPLRLAIVGAVHIAQHLLPMAQACGYQTYVIDPRPVFVTPQRFPQGILMDDWPDAALGQIGLDARAAVVTLAHDPKIDDPAIAAALASDVFYLGCLGSRRTHAKRLDRLRATGFEDAALARINGPVGLDIGGREPAEIAISIMAQMTQVLRQP